MKNRVGTLYGKPVVIGDKNLVTDNEIHVSNLSNNKVDEGGSNNPVKYYRFTDRFMSGELGNFIIGMVTLAYTFIYNYLNKNYITTPGVMHSNGVPQEALNGVIAISIGINTFIEAGEITIYDSFEKFFADNVSPELKFTDYFIQISEEEYYDLIK